MTGAARTSAFQIGDLNARYLVKGLLGFVILAIAGCANAPSITESDEWLAPRDADLVSVCYSAQVSTREDVAALARSKCPPDQQWLIPLQEDAILNNCPLVKRLRVTFQCVSRP